MKTGKFKALIKKKGYGLWINVGEEEVYLSTGASIYKAYGLPVTKERSVAKAILDIDAKDDEKITFEIKNVEDSGNVLGCDLSDGFVKNEQSAEHLRTAAIVDGNVFSVIRAGNGELIFYNRILLAPLADKLKDKDSADYITYSVRFLNDVQPYIVVKDGFQTLAAIMPMKVLNDDYISELQDFQLMCIDQLLREKDREKHREKLRQQEEGQQETMPEVTETTKPEKTEEELQELADRACEATSQTEDRDCEHCGHYQEVDGKRGCNTWDCDYEPIEDEEDNLDDI